MHVKYSVEEIIVAWKKGRMSTGCTERGRKKTERKRRKEKRRERTKEIRKEKTTKRVYRKHCGERKRRSLQSVESVSTKARCAREALRGRGRPRLGGGGNQLPTHGRGPRNVAQSSSFLQDTTFHVTAVLAHVRGFLPARSAPTGPTNGGGEGGGGRFEINQPLPATNIVFINRYVIRGGDGQLTLS